MCINDKSENQLISADHNSSCISKCGHVTVVFNEPSACGDVNIRVQVMIVYLYIYYGKMVDRKLTSFEMSSHRRIYITEAYCCISCTVYMYVVAQSLNINLVDYVE